MDINDFLFNKLHSNEESSPQTSQHAIYTIGHMYKHQSDDKKHEKTMKGVKISGEVIDSDVAAEALAKRPCNGCKLTEEGVRGNWRNLSVVVGGVTAIRHVEKKDLFEFSPFFGVLPARYIEVVCPPIRPVRKRMATKSGPTISPLLHPPNNPDRKSSLNKSPVVKDAPRTVSVTVQQLLSTQKENEELEVYIRRNEELSDDDMRMSKRRTATGGRKKKDKKMSGVKSTPASRRSSTKTPAQSPRGGAPTAQYFASPGTALAKKPNKRPSVSKTRNEEIYTDKDRAAAVNFGSKDIKQDLRVKKNQERLQLYRIPDDFDPGVFVIQAEHEIKKGCVQLAIATLHKALGIDPNHKETLVCRSKCYLRLGDSENALRDVETALRKDPKYIKAVLQKAETMYHMGRFEDALVEFHRGHRFRPGMEQFRLGVQKCQEAIQNSVADKKASEISESVEKLEPMMLRLLDREDQQVAASKEPREPGDMAPPKWAPPPIIVTMCEEINENDLEAKVNSKILLGVLNKDKRFLKQIEKNPNLIQNGNWKNYELQKPIKEALAYLRNREEFWRLQKPLYARLADNPDAYKDVEEQSRLARQRKQENMTLYYKDQTNKAIDDIDRSMGLYRPQEVVDICNKTLKLLDNMPSNILENKIEVEAYVLLSQGQALIILKRCDEAIESLEEAAELSDELENVEFRYRCVDWLGRAYALCKRYEDAMKVWKERKSTVREGVERAWWFHEMGRCYLETKDNKRARNYAEKCLLEVQYCPDNKYMVNAAMILATQIEVKERNYPEAQDHLLDARAMAEADNDHLTGEFLRECYDKVEKLK